MNKKEIADLKSALEDFQKIELETYSDLPEIELTEDFKESFMKKVTHSSSRISGKSCLPAVKAVAVITVVVILFSSAMNVNAFRGAVSSVIAKTIEGYTSVVVMLKGENIAPKLEVFPSAYKQPSEYEYYSEKNFDGIAEVKWTNGVGRDLIILEKRKLGGEFHVKDDLSGYTVIENDACDLYMTYADGSRTIIWATEYFSYLLLTPTEVSEGDAINMALSIIEYDA